jgi:hypothetical protein
MQSEPWNADLLDHLAVHLADNKYDLKSVLYLIATSEAYQSQCVTRRGESAEGSTGKFVYQGPLPRRMTAEQFLDSVWQMTSAAPTAFDAPVIRNVPQAADSEPVALQAKWIWGDSAAGGCVPPSGEAILLRRQFVLSADADQGGAVLTCDNGFALFINGREVKSGSEWTKTEAVPLRGLLKKGENTVVAIATNAGNGPNAAGFFFESRVKLTNGEVITVVSDESWEWNANVPARKEGRLGRITGDWKSVTIVPALDVWTNSVAATAPNLLMQALTGNLQMIRASLMKNDFLMRSLGRPFREQIVSMRPTELTTLEAIDLSNGATLAGYLSTGATNLANGEYTDRTAFIDHLYEFALSRKPLPEEKAILNESLSSPPTTQEIEDVLWAIFMTPEFFLVR